MNSMRDQPREFDKPIAVTCHVCDKTTVMTAKQRNNPRNSGKWCDGEYGFRHKAVVMVGPKGRHYE